MTQPYQSSSFHEIKFFNRKSGKIETEKVYGDKLIRFLYTSQSGQKIGRIFTNKFFSTAYGAVQNLPITSRKVPPFVEKFNIDLEDFEAGSHSSLDKKKSYKNFNEFFIRRFKLGKRPFVHETHRMPAFSEARYVGFEAMSDKSVYPVKGHFLKAKDLISHEQIGKIFEGGPLLIARLCPVDYHRYHYPDDGRVLDHYRVSGLYDSVNPLALKFKNEIFIRNERHVSLLQTENFGKLAYIEVGAVCVGKIVQTHKWEKPFLRGEEKGYFLFGGSTVILMGEKGFWKPSEDILTNTKKNMETFIQLGDEVAVKGQFYK